MGTHPIFESDFDCLTDFVMRHSKPFNFSPDPSQKMRNDKNDTDDESDIDDSEDEVSFLSILRKEAEEEKVEPLTDTQRMMQTQDEKVEMVCEEKVETRVVTTITRSHYYLRKDGQRVVVSSDGPNVYITESVKTQNTASRVASNQVSQQSQSQIVPMTRKRKRIAEPLSSSDDEEAEVARPEWLEKWGKLKLTPGPTRCRRTPPIVARGSRVFCRYNTAFYPATVIDVEPGAFRVIYDDVAMKQKRVLVKRVDTRLISELGRGMTVLARKSIDSDYQGAVVLDSHQKTNLLDMTQKDGQIECALNTGYVVRFNEDNHDATEHFIPNSDIAIDSHVFNDENSQPLHNFEVVVGQSDDDLNNIVDSKRKGRNKVGKRILIVSSTAPPELVTHCHEHNIQLEPKFDTSIWLEENSTVDCMVLFDGDERDPVFTLGTLWNLPIVKFEHGSLTRVKHKLPVNHMKQVQKFLRAQHNDEQLTRFIERAMRQTNGFGSFAKLRVHLSHSK